MKKRKHYKISLNDLIKKGYIKKGEQLIYIYKKGQKKGKLVNGVIIDGEEIETNGKKFTTLSSAAKEHSTHSVNGWKWWKIRDGKGGLCSISKLREKYKEKKLQK